MTGKVHGGYLIYYIDEGLSIITAEMSNRFNLLGVREGGRDQGGALMHCEGVVD